MAFTLYLNAQRALAPWRHFPWRRSVQMLAQRFRHDRLGLTASSLTFTSILALVPFVTVALAAFTAFPMFGKTQELLQRWLMESLIPESIARQVLSYITQFAAKASRLGMMGFSVLMLTALMLVLTIDRTLNSIWRVRRLRPLGQRVLIYWAVLTLGPLLLGLSVAFTSYVASASRGLVAQLPGSLHLMFDSVEFLVLVVGMAGLYHYVPNTQVCARHALAGGFFVALGMEVAKKALSLYLAQVPTYSAIYGTFATMPILLLWIYVVWVIVLLGAVFTAHLPSLLAQGQYTRSGPGWMMALALQVLGQLQQERTVKRHRVHQGSLSMADLTHQLHADALQLEPVLEALCMLGWVGAMSDFVQASTEQAPRFVLLIDPQRTAIDPLWQHLLLQRCEALERLWQHMHVAHTRLSDVLPNPATAYAAHSDDGAPSPPLRPLLLLRREQKTSQRL